MDEADLAQRDNEAIQEYILEHRHTTTLCPSVGINCIDCTEEIPAARRAALPGCDRCIECQRAYEHEQELELHHHWGPL